MKLRYQEVEEATTRDVEVATWRTTLRDVNLDTMVVVDQATGRAFDGVTRKSVNMAPWRAVKRAVDEI